MVQAKKKPTVKKLVKPKAKKAVAVKSVVLPTATSKLLSRSEGLEVDFKRDAEAVKQDDLVAFANSGGGTILVGVDESKGKNGAQLDSCEWPIERCSILLAPVSMWYLAR